MPLRLMSMLSGINDKKGTHVPGVEDALVCRFLTAALNCESIGPSSR